MVEPNKPARKNTTKSQSKKKAKKPKKNPLPASPTITGDMSGEELEFIKAIDDFKRKNNRPFPTWREILSILNELGYRKQPGSEKVDELPEGSTPPADLV